MDRARPGAGSAMSIARRHAATEAHQRTVATINEMFDRLDELTTARDRLTGIATRQPDDDPIQEAELLLEHARRLDAALHALRAAALAASTYRARGELATAPDSGWWCTSGAVGGCVLFSVLSTNPISLWKCAWRV